METATLKLWSWNGVSYYMHCCCITSMCCREKNVYFIQKCEGVGMKHEHGVKLGPGTNGCMFKLITHHLQFIMRLTGLKSKVCFHLKH